MPPPPNTTPARLGASGYGLDAVYNHGNLLRMAFQPVTVFRLSLLPPQRAAPAEPPHEFAERVAALLADKLGVPATGHTTRDKAAHLQLVRRIGKAEWLRKGARRVA